MGSDIASRYESPKTHPLLLLSKNIYYIRMFENHFSGAKPPGNSFTGIQTKSNQI